MIQLAVISLFVIIKVLILNPTSMLEYYHRHVSQIKMQPSTNPQRRQKKQKNNDYADRIKNYLGGSFFPCVFTSGGGIGPSANKVISELARKASLSSLERYEDIKEEIKRDVVFSLIKSRIQGIRSSKNSISSQTYSQNDSRV